MTVWIYATNLRDTTLAVNGIYVLPAHKLAAKS
jgi:hypothetical protein